MAKNEFERWFDNQFGKCPMSNNKALNLQTKIQSAEMELNSMKRNIRSYRDWHANYKAARYAYNLTTIGGERGKK